MAACRSLDAQIQRLAQEKTLLKKATALSLSYALIDQLREQQPVELVCSVFEIPRSSYYDYPQRNSVIDTDRIRLRSQDDMPISLPP